MPVINWKDRAEKAEAELARLRAHMSMMQQHAAPPAQPAQRLTDEPQWRPIKTAPKDGTQYLACDGKKMWTRNQPPNCYAGDWECNQNRTQWRGHADGLNPSHWMPLPKSPEAI